MLRHLAMDIHILWVLLARHPVVPRRFAGPPFGGVLLGFKVRLTEILTLTMPHNILRLSGHSSGEDTLLVGPVPTLRGHAAFPHTPGNSHSLKYFRPETIPQQNSPDEE